VEGTQIERPCDHSRETGNRLSGRVVPVTALSGGQLAQLYSLREMFFTSVTPGQFEDTILAKHWAILLVDPSTGGIQGFSTIKRIETIIDGGRVVAYSSGETAVHPSHWGQAELPRVAGSHIMAMAEGERDARAYWFLITSSYRTYRFLPLFFRDYCPKRGSPVTKEMRRTLEKLAFQEFGEEYDPASGVIRFDGATPLLREYAVIPSHRTGDPDIAFFARVNPGYLSGEELACLAALNRENLTPAGLRILARGSLRPKEEAPRLR